METLNPTTALQASMIIIGVTLLILIIISIQVSRAVVKKVQPNENVTHENIPKFTYITLKITKEAQNNDKKAESTSSISVNVDANGNITSQTTTGVPKP